MNRENKPAQGKQYTFTATIAKVYLNGIDLGLLSQDYFPEAPYFGCGLGVIRPPRKNRKEAERSK